MSREDASAPDLSTRGEPDYRAVECVRPIHPVTPDSNKGGNWRTHGQAGRGRLADPRAPIERDNGTESVVARRRKMTHRHSLRQTCSSGCGPDEAVEQGGAAAGGRSRRPRQGSRARVMSDAPREQALQASGGEHGMAQRRRLSDDNQEVQRVAAEARPTRPTAA